MRASLAMGQLLVGIAIFALLAPSHAQANDALRCGSKLVTQGDTRDAVRELCGAPTDVLFTSVLRRPSYVRHGRVIYFGENAVESRVETWTYNFGPNRLMRKLRFVDGILEDVETLGYGYNSYSGN